MFKKKMPRFGSSGVRMPRMPKPPKPRAKKFQDGGEVDEVIVGPGAAQQEYSNEISQSEKRRKERALAAEKSLVKRYLAASKKAGAKKPESVEMDRETLRREFDAYMQEQELKKKQAEAEFRRDMKQGIRTARSGGKMESCCRGDGIASRGKTRGKFV
jgi:hypothetical protein